MQEDPIRDKDEIDLLDLFYRLWRRKYIIIGGTAIITLAVLVTSMSVPKTYRVSMVVQPGIIGMRPNLQPIYIDSIISLKDLVVSGAFTEKIIDDIGLPDRQMGFAGLNFQVPQEDERRRFLRPEQQPKTLHISYVSTEPEYGIKALNSLGENLLQHYQRTIDQQQQKFNMQIKAKSKDLEKTSNMIARIRNDIIENRGKIELQIKKKENEIFAVETQISTLQAATKLHLINIQNQKDTIEGQINTLEADQKVKITAIHNQIDITERQISTLEANKKVELAGINNQIANLEAQKQTAQKMITNIEERIAEIDKEIDRTSQDSDRLLKERMNFLAASGDEPNALSVVMYNNTTQQNISYINNLRNTFNDLNTQILDQNDKIKRQVNDIKDLEAQLVAVEEKAAFEKAKLTFQKKDLVAETEGIKQILLIETLTLKAKIVNLSAQKENLEKQLSIKIKAFEKDIESLEAQKEKLEEKLVLDNDKLGIEIKDLQADNKFIKEEIEDLNYKKGNLQNITILRPATMPHLPIKANTKRYLALTMVGSGLLMMIIVLLIEAVAGVRKRRDFNQTTD